MDRADQSPEPETDASDLPEVGNQLGNKISIYQPDQPGLKFPELPEFASVEEERRHRKERLVAACRVFARNKFDYGFAGHISVRDPEHTDLYWTNPMSVHFAQVNMHNLILADHEGNVVEGDYAINRAGFILHASVHHAHPDIVAMCHAHTPHGTAWCSTGREIPPLNQDAACFFENHAVVAEDGGAVTVLKGQGATVIDAFKDNRAVLHQAHGILTASRHSVDDATWWFLAMDRCCAVQLMIEASGIGCPVMDEAKARHSATHVGSDYIGWLHFQTLYEEALATWPDMLD